jgi:hypothetical protein
MAQKFSAKAAPTTVTSCGNTKKPWPNTSTSLTTVTLLWKRKLEAVARKKSV